jgi:hypothetical protein
MQKVADRAAAGKAKGSQKVDTSGSYAYSVERDLARDEQTTGPSRCASRRCHELRKKCATRFGLDRENPRGLGCARSVGAPPRSVAAGHGGARRGAAIAPGRNHGRGGTAGSGDRSALARALGRRARRAGDRSAIALAARSVPALRCGALRFDVVRQLPSVWSRAGGAS